MYTALAVPAGPSASGIALSFCDGDERAYLKDISKLTLQTIPVVSEHPYPLSVADRSRSANTSANSYPQRSNNNGNQNSNGNRWNNQRNMSRSY